MLGFISFPSSNFSDFRMVKHFSAFLKVIIKTSLHTRLTQVAAGIPFTRNWWHHRLTVTFHLINQSQALEVALQNWVAAVVVVHTFLTGVTSFLHHLTAHQATLNQLWIHPGYQEILVIRWDISWETWFKIFTFVFTEPDVSHGKPKKLRQPKPSKADGFTTLKSPSKPGFRLLSEKHLEQPLAIYPRWPWTSRHILSSFPASTKVSSYSK